MTATKTKKTNIVIVNDNRYQEGDTKQHLKLPWSSHHLSHRRCRRRRRSSRSSSSILQQQQGRRTTGCPGSEHVTNARSGQAIFVLLVMLVLVVVCFCPFYSVMAMTVSRHHGMIKKKTSKTMTMEGRRMGFIRLDVIENRRSSTTSTSSLHSLPKPSHQSRRKFFHKFLSSTSATAAAAAAAVTVPAVLFQPEPANAAAGSSSGIFTYIRPSQSYMQYEDFKTLLETDQLTKVEFGIDGRSLVCLDTSGKIHNLKDMPDDRPLLKELYDKGVTVTLQEMKYEKKMNTINWFRDLVGVGDDLTDEDMYEYRGYKTYRQNIPERSYVPANLITGYDLSRNMRK